MAQVAQPRRTALVASAALVLGAAASREARADAPPADGGRMQQIIARGHLVIGTGADIPPFYFQNESGEMTGMEVDLARLLAKGLFNDPSKVEFVTQTSDARIPNLLSGRVDAVIQNLTVTAARAQQVEFSLPYYRAGQGFMLRSNGRCKDFDALRSAGSAVTVSAIENVFVSDWVHAALPQARVEPFPTADAAQQALDGGRADAQFITQARIAWMVKQAPQRYADSGYTYLANSIAIAVHTGEPKLLNWINTALREAMLGVDFPAFAALYEHWLGMKLPTPKVGYPHEMIA